MHGLQDNGLHGLHSVLQIKLCDTFVQVMIHGVYMDDSTGY